MTLIDVLLVAAPIGLVCWVLPQTNSWACLWSTTFFSAVFTQFLQVIALKLGGSLLTDLTPMAPDAALLAVFLGIAVLVLTLKIPGLMRHHASEGLGFVRYLAYQQASRAISSQLPLPHNTRSPVNVSSRAVWRFPHPGRWNRPDRDLEGAAGGRVSGQPGGPIPGPCCRPE